ncbi:MAG TPA: hypothetical protein VII56_02360 [Rhizomicrobium sp.]
MNFVAPTPEELSKLRADPLIFEQELDVRPLIAESFERVVGFRAGRKYWRSAHSHIYALELGDLGRGRPSLAFLYGFWPRFEPRPPEIEIDNDLKDFALWMANVCDGLDPADIEATIASIAIIRERAK